MTFVSSLFAARARHLVGLLALGGTVAGLASGGCSSTTADPGPAPSATGTTAAAVCDSAKCAPGNECIKVGAETKCRKTCSSNVDAAKACPTGYACTALAPQEAECTGAQCFCAESGPKVEKKPTGQWTARCNPIDGISSNKACDSAQGFTCFAQNPVDGEAYCTRACEKDTDCAAGLFCGTVNDSPSAEAGSREGTGTIKVCQKRAYGSPCNATVDCGGGLICIPDDSGKRFCTSKCTTDNNCTVDAFCGDRAGGAVCYPNAGVLVGDGNFCSPCRSDLDCAAGKGLCVGSSYTTERFCTSPSASACKSKDCPSAPTGVTGVACTTKAYDDIPAGMCIGLFKLGTTDVPGCWTRTRRK